MNELEIFLVIIYAGVTIYSFVIFLRVRKLKKMYNGVFYRRYKSLMKSSKMTPERKRSLEKSRKFHEDVENRKNAQTLDDVAKKLVEDIPEEKEYLEESIRFNGELLGHVYFADDFTNHLIEMLKRNEEVINIKRYCDFIEYMWRNGDNDVINIFDVTIAEGIAHTDVWKKFGKYISNELIEYINEILIPNNILMYPDMILEKNDNQKIFDK